jgi:hypothetical protein
MWIGSQERDNFLAKRRKRGLNPESPGLHPTIMEDSGMAGEQLIENMGQHVVSLMISYSRKDKEFVKKLYAGLVDHSIPADNVWVDWEGIPLSADWMEEITRGIRESDIFL